MPMTAEAGMFMQSCFRAKWKRLFYAIGRRLAVFHFKAADNEFPGVGGFGNGRFSSDGYGGRMGPVFVGLAGFQDDKKQ